ncbi:MAG: hypothetical protein U0359_31035 [Byssovorax sp.]
MAHRTLTSIEIPQADSLENVRRIVEAIASGASSRKDIEQKTDISLRHIDYTIHAAKSLGFLTDGDALAVSDRGRALIATARGTNEERAELRAAFKADAVLEQLAPDLLDEPGPSKATLTERIQKACPELSAATAARRAQTLLAWRSQATGALGPAPEAAPAAKKAAPKKAPAKKAAPKKAAPKKAAPKKAAPKKAAKKAAPKKAAKKAAAPAPAAEGATAAPAGEAAPAAAPAKKAAKKAAPKKAAKKAAPKKAAAKKAAPKKAAPKKAAPKKAAAKKAAPKKAAAKKAEAPAAAPAPAAEATPEREVVYEPEAAG